MNKMKFNLDNPILQFINMVCNYIALNLVFLISCLPIITIGSALSALYYVTLKESRGEEGYLVRPYLSAFKKNLLSGTKSFVLLLLVGSILLFNLCFWSALSSIISFILTFIVALGVGMYLLIALYTFPLIARFQNHTLQTLKNAFLIAVNNVLPTLALLAIHIIAILLFLYVPQVKLFMLIMGFAFVAYCESFLFTKVFTSYEPKLS